MKKVLIIDDEPFILMIVEDKLTKAGYEVITRRSSDGLDDLIKSKKPDLVIMDWMLPGESGLDICKKLRNDPSTCSIPVFMLTAKGQEADEKMGLKCGARQYITKPFSPKALLNLVEEVIGKSK